MTDKIIAVSVSLLDLRDAISILRDAGMPLSPFNGRPLHGTLIWAESHKDYTRRYLWKPEGDNDDAHTYRYFDRWPG
jgi:hypothetical protein